MTREPRICQRGHTYEVSRPTYYTGQGAYPQDCPRCRKKC